MPGFHVDSRTLLAVRDTLGRLHDQLLSMHTTIYGDWGTLGGAELAGELEHFCGTWHYGVTELAVQIQDLMRRLAEAAAAYERIEQRVTRAGASESGSGTTIIDPGAPAGSRVQTPSGHGHTGGSGSGTTVIGGGYSGGRSGTGSGTTVIDGGPARPDGGVPARDGAQSGSGTVTIG